MIHPNPHPPHTHAALGAVSDDPAPARARSSALPDTVDLLVIGGGIVGAGVARDAALRGLSTLLVDQYDFAFGTSSRSSRLLHGGLRYLAQGRMGLVREASHEKLTLARIAPHLAAALPFLFPTYKKSGWSRWKLRIGVKLYDWLCGGPNLGKSSGLSPADALAKLPHLNPTNLTGGVRYFDGFTNDARLVLDTLRSAERAGAHLSNYTTFTHAQRAGDLWECHLHATEDGPIQSHRPPLHPIAPVRARAVVNAAGAWASSFAQSQVKLRLTKGVHVVVDAARLAVPEAVVMTDGPRILFAIPWGDRTILGTTDTDYDGPIDSPDCSEEDLTYVLDIVNRTFPAANLKRYEIVSAWAGLRPLIADSNGKPSDISRAHEILNGEPGWYDVAGGKLTTYRLMAEQTVDKICQHLGHILPPCRTADEPLLPPDCVDGVSGILPPAVTKEAVLHFCRHEWARHLDDVMIRRTAWLYYHRDHLDLAARVADWMAEALAWASERTAQELHRYDKMTRPLAPRFTPPTAPTHPIDDFSTLPVRK
jgi:glycerol-3-phosphate dehydrogenase